MSGVTGQFYRQFAVTIAISTVISAINSLTLSPALAAKLLRPHDAPKDALTRGNRPRVRLAVPAVQPLLRPQPDRYHGFVGRTLKRRGVVFAVYAALLAATALLLNAVPGGFIPVQDKLYLFAGAKLPEGASLARTQRGDRADDEDRARHRRCRNDAGVCRAERAAGREHTEHHELVCDPEAVRPAPPQRRADQRGPERALRGHRRRHHLCADAAADPGLGNGSGYSAVPGGSRRGRLRGLAERAHRVPGRGREDAGDELPGQLVPGEHPAARGEGRPVEGEGAGRRVDRPVQHAAGLSRLDVRERLQPVRPRVPRDGAGGCRAPADGRRHREPAHAQREGRDGADRLDGDGGARVWAPTRSFATTAIRPRT